MDCLPAVHPGHAFLGADEVVLARRQCIRRRFRDIVKDGAIPSLLLHFHGQGVSAGTAKLVGTDRADIVREASILLSDQAAYNAMSKAANPYGDGLASERIADAILHWSGRGERPRDFRLTIED